MGAVRFGLNVSTSAAPGADPVADARRAEELGFDFVSAFDHLHGEQPSFETWTMLSWIAAATSRLRVATRVLAVPYRSPAAVIERLRGFLALGFTALNFMPDGPGTDEQAERLAKEAIPALRSRS